MLGTFPGMVPATSIHLLPVAVIIMLTKEIISYAKIPSVEKGYSQVK